MTRNQQAALRPRTYNTRSSGRNVGISPALAARLAAESPPAAAKDRARPARSEGGDDDEPTPGDMQKLNQIVARAVGPIVGEWRSMKRDLTQLMVRIGQGPAEGQHLPDSPAPAPAPSPSPVGLKPSASGATGQGRAVTTVLTSLATQVYQSAADGHKKMYEFNQALNQEMVDAFLAKDMVGLERLLQSHAAFCDLLVDACEHLGGHPGCGLNSMLQYTSGRLLKCLRDPASAKFNKAAADSVLAQVRADSGRSSGGGQAAAKKVDRSPDRHRDSQRDSRDYSRDRSGAKRPREGY